MVHCNHLSGKRHRTARHRLFHNTHSLAATPSAHRLSTQSRALYIKGLDRPVSIYVRSASLVSHQPPVAPGNGRHTVRPHRIRMCRSTRTPLVSVHADGAPARIGPTSRLPSPRQSISTAREPVHRPRGTATTRVRAVRIGDTYPAGAKLPGPATALRRPLLFSLSGRIAAQHPLGYRVSGMCVRGVRTVMIFSYLTVIPPVRTSARVARSSGAEN